MDILKMLSPEERAEYNDLLSEAGYVDGAHAPSSEVGQRMHDLLENAARAGRPWAEWVLRDDALAGHLSRFKQWDKAREKQMAFVGGAIVPIAAVRGVKRFDKTGRRYDQQAFWREMSWDDVRAVLNGSKLRIRAEQITVSVATRLLMLHMEQPDSAGPADACDQAGYEFDAFMAGEVAS